MCETQYTPDMQAIILYYRTTIIYIPKDDCRDVDRNTVGNWLVQDSLYVPFYGVPVVW